MEIDNNITEAASPTYKRKGTAITRYYRCTSGPKKGKLASDPSKCGNRPDPKRVRHGRKVARTRGAIRVRKTQVSKKQQVSKRITQLNRMLRNRRTQNNRPTAVTNESFLDFLNVMCPVEYPTAKCDTILEFLDDIETKINEDMSTNFSLHCTSTSIKLMQHNLTEGESEDCSLTAQLSL